MQPKDPLEAIRAQFPQALQDVETFREKKALIIAPEALVEVCQFLRDTDGLEYLFLVDVTGIDYYQRPAPARFAVIYHLYSLLYNTKLRLKVYTDEDELRLPSITPLWPSANWQEREVFDMFGIEFEGHPDMRRILMSEDWDGYPQRKDYPLGYETVQFSFNVDEINKFKPYAKE